MKFCSGAHPPLELVSEEIATLRSTNLSHVRRQNHDTSPDLALCKYLLSHSDGALTSQRWFANSRWSFTKSEALLE